VYWFVLLTPGLGAMLVVVACRLERWLDSSAAGPGLQPARDDSGQERAGEEVLEAA
jgi:hypothetical protein